MNRIIEHVIWQFFYIFENLGLHVLPITYYSPIPDTRQLRNHLELLTQEHPMLGVDLREEAQLGFLDYIRIMKMNIFMLVEKYLALFKVKCLHLRR